VNISLVIPVYNEFGNIHNLEKEIRSNLENLDINWECIWVDDSSTDKTWEDILVLPKSNRGIRLRNNSGQTTATMAGIDSAKYEYIVTIDGDGQNDPADIVSMVNLIKNFPNYNLIQGYRGQRSDNFFSRIVVSKIANLLVRKISGYQIIDLGCSLRLFRKDLMNNFRLTGEMHRLFTLYLIDNGAKIKQIDVNHRARIIGKSKYDLRRIIKLFVDILLYKAHKKIFTNPLYTFGKLALFGYVMSLTIFSTAIFLRILQVKDYIDTTLISTSLIIFSTSSIFIGLGLIGEMVTRLLFENSKNYQYTVIEKYN